MKKAAELYNALKKITGTNDSILPAIVKEVNADGTINVELDGLELYDVRIKSVVKDGTKGIAIKPAVDSVVLLQRIGKDNEFAVVLFSEVDEVEQLIATTKFKQDESGFEIKKGDETLKKLLTDTLEQIKAVSAELQKVVVVIGVNPNVAALAQIDVVIEQIKTRTDNLLN